MAIDLVGPGITVGIAVLSAGAAWFARSIRTGKDVEALSIAKDDHEKRLDGHDTEIDKLKSDYVPRAELNEKLELYFNPIQRQMDQQTRMLEYVVLGKTPDHPLHGKKE